MRLLRHLSLHDECAIYSVDFHPQGDRFVTSGADKKIKIWGSKDMSATSTTSDNATVVPANAMIAELCNHQVVTFCVRWSPCGRFIASGGDDTHVFLWEENATWHRASQLRGHTMDVLDLAWSATFLASCSIDNRVLIWDATDAKKQMVPLRALSGHKNWVKGVAWDPLGRFLASASEDGRVIVWRTSDWQMEAELTTTSDTGLTPTFFQRLSWSPDGVSLGLPNAQKAAQQIAAIVKRGEWDSAAADLVGHRQAVTVVRFSPMGVVAVGSQDAVISIWANSAERPLIVLKDVFGGAVSDLCWSPNGNLLVASSHDGSICTLILDSKSASLLLGLTSSSSKGSQRALLPSRNINTSSVETSGPFSKQTLSQDKASLPVVNTPPCSFEEEGVLALRRTSDDQSSGKKRSLVTTALGPKQPPRLKDATSCSLKDALSCTVRVSENTVLELQSTVTRKKQSGVKSVIIAARGGVVIWKSEVVGQTSALAGAGVFVLAGTAEGSLYFLHSLSGAITRPPAVLGAAVCQLTCGVVGAAINVAAITADGQIRIWDATAMELLVSISVMPALEYVRPRSGSILDCTIDTHGTVFLVLAVDAATEVFSVDRRMKCLFAIRDKRHLTALQDDDLSSICVDRADDSLALLEVSLASALTTNASSAALAPRLTTYMSHLVASHDEGRIRFLFERIDKTEHKHLVKSLLLPLVQQRDTLQQLASDLSESFL